MAAIKFQEVTQLKDLHIRTRPTTAGDTLQQKAKMVWHRKGYKI